jgi:hypothetical protein
MPWIDESFHVTFGPGAANLTPEELQAEVEKLKAKAQEDYEQQSKAVAALEGLPYAAIPLNQLADIYKRFLRLTRLGQGTIDEWNDRSEAESAVRRAVFQQADFGAVYAGQWLPKALREEVRNLVKGKRYDHNFDQHEVAYHRNRMDQLVCGPKP